MNISEEHIELIEKFLGGQLPADKRESIIKRIETDQEFASHVDYLRAIRSASRAQQLHQKFNLLKSVEDRQPPVIGEYKKKGNLTVWSLVGLAASIALIAALVFYPFKTKPERLMADHLTPLTLNYTRSGDQSSLSQAVIMYNIQEYKESANLFEKAVAEGASENQLMYAAISYLFEGDFEKAESLIIKIADNDYWPVPIIVKYQALALIGQNKLEEAFNLLDSTFPNHQYPPEVQPLSEDLRKISGL